MCGCDGHDFAGVMGMDVTGTISLRAVGMDVTGTISPPAVGMDVIMKPDTYHDY
jgi:hypothetical protein